MRRSPSSRFAPGLPSLGYRSTQFRDCDDDLSLRFGRDGALFIQGLLAADLVSDLGRRAAESSFSTEPVATIGVRSAETSGIIAAAISTMLSRREVLDWVAALVSDATLTSASGHVLRSTPAVGEELGWHDDLNEPDRRLAITVDLLGEPYSGGEFQLRRGSDVIFRHRHAEAGGAVIFAIGRGLSHRVTPVTFGAGRLVYAGWFS